MTYHEGVSGKGRAAFAHSAGSGRGHAGNSGRIGDLGHSDSVARKSSLRHGGSPAHRGRHVSRSVRLSLWLTFFGALIVLFLSMYFRPAPEAIADPPAFGPDGYFSTLNVGDRPVVSDGWDSARRIVFGKTDSSQTYQNKSVSGGYKTLAKGAVESVADADIGVGQSYSKSATTSVLAGEALLFADNTVTSGFTFDSSGNPFTNDFDSGAANTGYRSGPALASVGVASQNYSVFEQGLLRSAPVEGVCTNASGCKSGSYTQQTDSVNSYRVFPLSTGDVKQYFNHTSGLSVDSNLACPSKICVNNSSGFWLRSARWNGVAYAYDVWNDGAPSSDNTSFGSYGLRPALRLNLDNLLLSSKSTDYAQPSNSDAASSLTLTFKDESLPALGAINLDSSNRVEESTFSLPLGSTYPLTAGNVSAYPDGLGWKLVNQSSSDGTVAKSGSGTSLSTQDISAGTYDLYVWGLDKGSASEGVTHRGTAPQHFTVTIAEPESFEFTLNITDLNTNVVVPANGLEHAGPDYGAPYMWGVDWWTGTKWEAISCSTSANSDTANQTCNGNLTFQGKSRTGTDVGPQLGKPASWGVSTTGNLRMRLTNASNGGSTSWLNAFATASFDGVHQTASMITEVGDIPFLGIKDPDVAVTSAGNGTGKHMFKGASNLVRVGRVFYNADPGWASVTKTEVSFAHRMFEGTTSLETIGDGSFDLSSITKVGDFFGADVFHNSGIQMLPNASFNLSSISTINSTTPSSRGYFLSGAFRDATRLATLPLGSFNTWALTGDVYNDFFKDAFKGATSLTSLPDGSFNLSNVTGAGNAFFASAFQGATSLPGLPANSFKFGTSLNTVGADFFNSTFKDAHALNALPAGSFDLSNVTTVGERFLNMTYAGTTAATAPQLNRAAVVQVASKWSLNEVPSQASGVFTSTFENVSTATGKLLESDVAQLAKDPGDKKTFLGTKMCTDSTYSQHWGMMNCHFEFTVNIPANKLDEQLIVPANGRGTSETTFEVPYQWDVDIWNSGTSAWTPLACDSGVNNSATDYCISSTFAGQSADLANSGPKVGTPRTLGLSSAGNIKLRLKNANASEQRGWLRAFATSGSTSAHQTATLITSVGDVPFIGIRGISYAGSTGNTVAMSMFESADHLESIGAILNINDPDWAEMQTANWFFFEKTFLHAHALSSIASGSFHINNISGATGFRFFYQTFRDTPSLKYLPAGSFDTSNITDVLSGYFDQTFYGATSLLALPVSSFNTDHLLSASEGANFSHFLRDAKSIKHLPDGSFNISNLQHLGTYSFLSMFSGASALEDLPAGSFVLNTNVTTTGDRVFENMFKNAASLTSLPVGSFDTSHLNSVGLNFMLDTFAGDTKALAPKLNRAAVVQVASKWALSEASSQASGVFTSTFKNVATAKGKLLVSDAAQLTKDPGSTKRSFAGTGFCTDSPHAWSWGLINCNFEFTVHVDDASANLVVPTNGRANDGGTYGATYSWRIQRWDGSDWVTVPCQTSLNNGSGTGQEGCSGTDVYTGKSYDSSTAGPRLGAPSVWGAVNGTDVKLRLVDSLSSSNISITGTRGWLRAFGTYGASAHQTAPKIRSVGDIPFIGIKNDDNVEKTGNFAGYQMLRNASALTSVGKVLSPDDPDWVQVTTVGEYLLGQALFGASTLHTIGNTSLRTDNVAGVVGPGFFHATFSGNVSLESLPAASLNTSRITTVGADFFDRTFDGATSLRTLPDGSLDTENIISIGSQFFQGTFRNTSSLTGLPTGSLSFKNVPSANFNNVFEQTFFGATELKDLPADSFNVSKIAGPVGGNFFHATFTSTTLENLPDGSFNISKITIVGNNFFDQTFNNVSSLKSLPTGSFGIDSITGTTGNYFFFRTFRNTALQALPDSSFVLSSNLIAVGDNSFKGTFFNVKNLKSLPSGAFNTSKIATVGAEFMSNMFSGDSIANAPKLARQTVLDVVSKWNLDATNLTKTGVYEDTFRNNRVAQGEILVADATQIGMNPGAVRNTFTGTFLCSDSEFRANWGLRACSPPTALPYTGGLPIALLVALIGLGVLLLSAVLNRGRYITPERMLSKSVAGRRAGAAVAAGSAGPRTESGAGAHAARSLKRGKHR
ncbi:hypothetical protein [Bifidobacterium aquikefiricola]|uniref:BspA family leucine-rich repeat surface protein n=1 Tax=Bifidobacterium aquikefiricola TaxID=3059038 RepID=A0AB39U8H1_9BIFI